MNFYSKGQFKIQESWQQRPGSRESQKATSKDKKDSRETNDRNTPLLNAGRNMFEPTADLIDNEMSKRILREFAAEIPPSVKSTKKIPSKDADIKKIPPKQKNATNADDLLSSMAARLKIVELTSKNQREELKEKTQIIDKLKAENLFLKGLREDSGKQFAKMEELRKENEMLGKKVEEMQQYLKKYGLKWIGNKLEGDLKSDQLKKDIKKPQFNYRMPAEVDLGTVMRRVEELNGGLHSQGHGNEIYEENGVHKFRKAEPLPIGFFGNGIAIKGFSFYPYKSKESLHILSDLLDGYFPYVLKQKYPNGVFLKVVDKIAEKYQNQSDSTAITTFQSNANKDFKPPSKEQFLNKLPKQVVKNGKVINIRSEIEKRLNGELESIEDVEESNEFYEKRDGVLVFKTPLSDEDSCTLKIRDEGGQAMILQMEKGALMKEVYAWLSKVVKGPFKIMGNYPHRHYGSEETDDLEKLGLFPNAILHVQPAK